MNRKEEAERALSECNDTKCFQYLLQPGKLASLSIGEKKSLVHSDSPTPNLVIVQTNKNKNRNFHRSLYKTPWVAGCSHLNKLFCWYCVLFSDEKGVWNTTGYSDLNNVCNAIKRHQSSKAHLNAAIAFHRFGKIRMETSLSRLTADEIESHNRKVDYNRNVFHRLIDMVCYLGQQELACHGHGESDHSLNREKFLELVNLFAKYDPVLETHLHQSTSGPSYLSHHIQDDIISSISAVILKHIKSELEEAPFVSVMIDENPDVCNKEQLALIFRYYLGKDIHDRFIEFIDVSKYRTTDFISTIVLEKINSMKCAEKLIAQTYDGASVTADVKNGIQAKVKKDCPRAMFVWCSAHVLNLVLSKSCSRIGEISGFFQSLNSLVTFFNNSTKRSQFYISFCEKQLPKVAPTRWFLPSSRIVSAVMNEKGHIQEVLEAMSDSPTDWDGETNELVYHFSNLFESFNFNFFLAVFDEIFNKTDVLYNIVQKSHASLDTCQREITEFDEWLLITFRLQFDAIYSSVLASSIPPKRKRNIDCVKLYYEMIFIEIIDNISLEINSRYSEINKLKFFKLLDNESFSSYSQNFPQSEMVSLESHYGSFFDMTSLKSQLIGIYSSPELRGLHVLELLDFLNENGLVCDFPEVVKLANLIISIPATSAPAERSFSALKRIHTYLRNTQKQNCVSDLSRISIEKALLIKLKRSGTFFEEVINEFLKKGTRIDLMYK